MHLVRMGRVGVQLAVEHLGEWGHRELCGGEFAVVASLRRGLQDHQVATVARNVGSGAPRAAAIASWGVGNKRDLNHEPPRRNKLGMLECTHIQTQAFNNDIRFHKA